jgi:hypothetical protein
MAEKGLSCSLTFGQFPGCVKRLPHLLIGFDPLEAGRGGRLSPKSSLWPLVGVEGDRTPFALDRDPGAFPLQAVRPGPSTTPHRSKASPSAWA